VQLKQSIGKYQKYRSLFFEERNALARTRVCVRARIREYFIPVMKQINNVIVVDLFCFDLKIVISI